MNPHQRIRVELARQYESMADAVEVTYSALAYRVWELFSNGDEDPNIHYAALEHYKQMSRAFLRARHDPDGEENEAVQHDLDFGPRFSGRLQDRYPVPRMKGEEPVYKLRQHLTASERAWNVRQLRRSASARLEHADALEAEGQMQSAA
ncbi:hypothetical protein ACTZWW_04360 [Salinarimonas sp. NSM]|uniref:hypothetical protein n=1 Tax=Salinarimonas sp. NSM TaxID=3458003 RepID=UPI004035B029